MSAETDPDEFCANVENLIFGWELAAADELLATGASSHELAPWIAYHRAVVAELRERFELADELYSLAFSLGGEDFACPVRMSGEAAQELLASIAQTFPEEVRAALENLMIEIVEVPTAVIDRDEDTDPMVLGLYRGIPIGEKLDVPIAMPDSVRIFKRNIERLAVDREHLVEQLRITLLHEVGHHLGWDEDDLETRGLA